MKKFICLLTVLTLVFTMAFSASANAKDDVIAAVKGAVHPDIYSKYEGYFLNTLKQIEVSPEQASNIIAIVNDEKSKADIGSDNFLKNASSETKNMIADSIVKAGEVVNLKVEYKPNEKKPGNYDFEIKKVSGEKVIEFTTNPVKKTGFEVNVTLIMIVSAIALAGAAFIVFKKNAATK